MQHKKEERGKKGKRKIRTKRVKIAKYGRTKANRARYESNNGQQSRERKKYFFQKGEEGQI